MKCAIAVLGNAVRTQHSPRQPYLLASTRKAATSFTNLNTEKGAKQNVS